MDISELRQFRAMVEEELSANERRHAELDDVEDEVYGFLNQYNTRLNRLEKAMAGLIEAVDKIGMRAAVWS